MRSLIKKELKIQFSSPVAAVVTALFLFLTGMAFSAGLIQPTPTHLPEASLRGIVYFMAVVLLFLCPLLTMRTLAEERHQGTIEILKTAPLTDRQIVLGKFFGIVILLALMLALTAEYPIFLALTGDPDPGPLILSYLGLFLLGAANCSVGLLASALTRNQIVAALVNFVLLLTLWFLPDLLGPVGEALSPVEHIHNFSLGVIDLKDLLYYLFFTAAFLLITIQKLEAER